MSHGMRAVSSVAGNVDVVVAGPLMGPSKWARCQKWNIPIVSVSEWIAWLEAGDQGAS
jgi:NAD-dependent DNA ligase